MDLPRVKGFGSNIYVALNFVGALFVVLYLSGLAAVSGGGFNALWFATVFCIFGAALTLFQRARAPLAYKRFSVNSEGVRFGNRLVKYSEIHSINVSSAYVNEWFGFAAFESLTGRRAHTEIPTEDVICINCEFRGYGRKQTDGCIYVPRNKKTDALLKKYCKAYADIQANKSEKCDKATNRGAVLYYVLATAILCVAVCFVTAMFFVQGLINVVGVALLVACGVFGVTVTVCKAGLAKMIKDALGL
ncbi:MAG: hypothetical protein IJ515_01495 [Clostridia bacterium]|nr:hypothetical protein [Clostridia bacterium]